jgi:cell division septation protein DedD
MTTTRRDYDPTERPLALDGRDPPPARRGPAPVTLLVSLLLLAGLGGGVFYLYRSGVRGPSGPPAPVGVPIRDVRVAAPPQPEAPDPAAGLSIYKDTPGTTQATPAPAFVAAPEQPTPRPAPGQEVLVAPTAGPIAAAPAEALAPPSKPVKTASIDSILASTPAPAKSTPKPTPTTTAAKAALASAKPATTADKPSDKTTGFVVQIGAFSSQAQADKSWESAAGVAPGAMAGKGKHIAPMSKDGATLYRVAITGFDNRAQAQALCAKLTAAGRTCFVR